MQVKNWMLATAITAVLASCGEAGTSSDNKNDSPGNTNSTTTITETKNKKTVEVSGATRTAFEAKYPQAKEVEWEYYYPEEIVPEVPIEWEWVGWKLDTTNYVANFNQENNDYWVWYDESGDWIGTVAEVSDHASLPAAVNKTVQSEFAGYTIMSVDMENDKNRTAYEVKMEKGEDKMKALIAENGEVLKKKGKVDDVKIKEKNKPQD